MSLPQYFAQIDETNVVLQIAVVTHGFMDKNPERYLGTWVETFINLPNKTYAGIGYVYDPTTQNFTPPIPEPVI